MVDPRASPFESSSQAAFRLRRALMLVVIVAAHLLLVLLLARSSPAVRVGRAASLSVFAVAVPNGSRMAALPSAREAAAPATPVSAPVASIAATGRTASSAKIGIADAETHADGCALAEAAARAILTDPAAMAEIGARPTDARNSSNVIMLWNGTWLDLETMPAAGSRTALRRAIEQVVAEASPQCREAETIGPQFIPILEEGGIVMVVIGSGTWHWADLMVAPSAASPPVEAPDATSSVHYSTEVKYSFLSMFHNISLYIIRSTSNTAAYHASRKG